MFKDIVRLFHQPSADVIAREELEAAQREYLKAQSGLDYARRMVEYHADRINRLSRYIKEADARRGEADV